MLRTLRRQDRPSAYRKNGALVISLVFLNWAFCLPILLVPVHLSGDSDNRKFACAVDNTRWTRPTVFPFQSPFIATSHMFRRMRDRTFSRSRFTIVACFVRRMRPPECSRLWTNMCSYWTEALSPSDGGRREPSFLVASKAPAWVTCVFSLVLQWNKCPDTHGEI